MAITNLYQDKIMGGVRGDPNPFAPEAWIESIKQDLELSNINYDMRFWDNYFDQLIDSTRKDPPMFRNGGLV
jgi:hypothetical protein